MRRNILIISLLVAAASLTAFPAWAQQPQTTTASGAMSAHGSGLGIGAVTMLNGTSGLLVTWGNARGSFHFDGLFGLRHYNPGAPDNTTDFSLGGGVGIIRWVQDPGGGGESDNLDLSLEVGGQIRAFIVPNVAFLADLGVGATFGGNDNILIGGQTVTGAGSPEGGSDFVVGTLGIAYFFE